MRKLKFFSLVLLGGALLTFNACKDDDDEKSGVDIITGGSSKDWRIASIVALGMPIQQDSCDADDYMTVKKEGNVLIDNKGVITCGEVMRVGSWSLTNDDKTFTMIDPNNPLENRVCTVTKLTEQSVGLQFTETSFGTPITVDLTLVPR